MELGGYMVTGQTLKQLLSEDLRNLGGTYAAVHLAAALLEHLALIHDDEYEVIRIRGAAAHLRCIGDGLDVGPLPLASRWDPDLSARSRAVEHALDHAILLSRAELAAHRGDDLVAANERCADIGAGVGAVLAAWYNYSPERVRELTDRHRPVILERVAAMLFAPWGTAMGESR